MHPRGARTEGPRVTFRIMSTHQAIIRAGRPWWHIDWKELVEYQDLLWLLVKRDLTAIYKQTILGPAWFVIQPLVTTLVFTIIFGKVAKVSTDGVPQFVFYMAGTVCGTTSRAVSTRAVTRSSATLGSYRRSFPSTGHPTLSRFFQPGSFCPQSGHVFGLLCLVFFHLSRHAADHGPVSVSPFDSAMCPDRSWCRSVGCGPHHQISRFAFCPAVSHPTLDVRHAHCLPSLSDRQSQVADTPLEQPHVFRGGCTRWMFTGSGTVTVVAGAISVGITFVLLITGLFLFNKVQRTFVDTI